jgi:hypothetical protein
VDSKQAKAWGLRVRTGLGLHGGASRDLPVIDARQFVMSVNGIQRSFNNRTNGHDSVSQYPCDPTDLWYRAKSMPTEQYLTAVIRLLKLADRIPADERGATDTLIGWKIDEQQEPRQKGMKCASDIECLEEDRVGIGEEGFTVACRILRTREALRSVRQRTQDDLRLESQIEDGDQDALNRAEEDGLMGTLREECSSDEWVMMDADSDKAVPFLDLYTQFVSFQIASESKAQGNEAFKDKKYTAALDLYAKALSYCQFFISHDKVRVDSCSHFVAMFKTH